MSGRRGAEGYTSCLASFLINSIMHDEDKIASFLEKEKDGRRTGPVAQCFGMEAF